jgi:hypothetical protein
MSHTKKIGGSGPSISINQPDQIQCRLPEISLSSADKKIYNGHRLSVRDVSLTIVETVRPMKLIRYFKEVCGFSIDKASNGIYVVGGNVFPKFIYSLNSARN